MKTGIERAKELFIQYSGNRFYMDLNGDGNEYEGYRVSAETEEEWREEYLVQFFEQMRYGKDALHSYVHAVSFLKSDRSDECWKSILYYPIRCDCLDDVTILYMLPTSFRLAEKWSKKANFPWKDAREYLQEFEVFAQCIRKRIDTGTLTRAEDYDLHEFSDPVYVEAHIKDLQNDWNRLLRSLAK